MVLQHDRFSKDIQCRPRDCVHVEERDQELWVTLEQDCL